MAHEYVCDGIYARVLCLSNWSVIIDRSSVINFKASSHTCSGAASGKLHGIMEFIWNYVISSFIAQRLFEGD